MPKSNGTAYKCNLIFKPVCECGYIFKNISFKYQPELPRKSTDMITLFGTSGFQPCSCPKCGRMIDGFILPMCSLDEWEYDEKDY